MHSLTQEVMRNIHKYLYSWIYHNIIYNGGKNGKATIREILPMEYYEGIKTHVFKEKC